MKKKTSYFITLSSILQTILLFCLTFVTSTTRRISLLLRILNPHPLRVIGFELKTWYFRVSINDLILAAISNQLHGVCVCLMCFTLCASKSFMSVKHPRKNNRKKNIYRTITLAS